MISCSSVPRISTPVRVPHCSVNLFKVVGQFLLHKNKLITSFPEIMMLEAVDRRRFAYDYSNATDGPIMVDKNNYQPVE